jgi:hypothetical protein
MRNVLLLTMILLAASLSFAQDARFDVPIGDSPSYGPGDAPVTMIEFIDYQ